MKLLTLIISILILFVSTVGVYESDCCGCCQGKLYITGVDQACCCGDCDGNCGDCDGGCHCDDCACSPFVACGTCMGFEVQKPLAVSDGCHLLIREIIVRYNNAIPRGWQEDILRPPRLIG